ncbi:MAG: hypothetical protein QHH80_06135, partial [Anaerolineae bacterium]|nr:hypothetical protein [Anaerolineae bacterium]
PYTLIEQPLYLPFISCPVSLTYLNEISAQLDRAAKADKMGMQRPDSRCLLRPIAAGSLGAACILKMHIAPFC